MTERTHYRVAEFAKARGIGLRTVRRAIAQGRLPVERVGRTVLIPVNTHVPGGHLGASDGTERQLRKQRPKKSERDRHFATPSGT